MCRFLLKQLLIFVSILVALPVSAQTDTDCSWFGNTLSCETRERNSTARAIGALFGAMARADEEERERAAIIEAEKNRLLQQQEAARKQQAAYMQQQAFAQQQAYLQEQERAFLTVVSQAVQAGECADAKAIALSRGRLDVADQAARLCTPRVASKGTGGTPRRRRK